MSSWETCPAAERDPGRVSGVSALFESLKAEASVERWMVERVLEHELEAPKDSARG
jgi:hypothetical protein